MPFVDRRDAGRRLGAALGHLRRRDVVVLGLPRGGVPVAFEVGLALGAPVDVVVVRKLGVPVQPELAMGAIGEGGVRLLDPDVIAQCAVTDEQVAAVERRERNELDRRVQRFRGGRPGVSLAGRTAVIVDDGVATGSTAKAASLVVRANGARGVVLAVPVASPRAVAELRRVADEVVALETPSSFFAIGEWYQNFAQTLDGEVVALLRAVRDGDQPLGPSPSGGDA